MPKAKSNSTPSKAPAPENVLNLQHAPEAKEGLELAARLRTMKVVDRESHRRVLEFIQGGKQLDRNIEAHYKKIKQAVDGLKRSVLTMERDDRAPVQEFIAAASRMVLDYENQERARVAREEAEQRERAEKEAAARRQKELEAADKRAADLEESASDLSAGQLWFVTKVFEQQLVTYLDPTPIEKKALLAIVKEAGYKDPAATLTKFQKTDKIIQAIAAKFEAAAIRTQQEALKEQPLDIDALTAPVETRLGSVSGVSTRTNYANDEEHMDVEALRAAFIAGKVPLATFVVDKVFLNQQARALKELFPQAFPGCRLKKTQTIAG